MGSYLEHPEALQAITTPEFYAIALKEYNEEKLARFDKVWSLLSTILYNSDLDISNFAADPENATKEEMLACMDRISAFVDDVVTNADLPFSIWQPFGIDGYQMTFYYWVTQLACNYFGVGWQYHVKFGGYYPNGYNPEEIELWMRDENQAPAIYQDKTPVPPEAGSGYYLANRLTWDRFFDFFTEGRHSLVSTISFFQAVQQPNVAAKLSTYRETVRAFLNNAESTTSDLESFFTNQLIVTKTIGEAVTTFASACDADHIASDLSEDRASRIDTSLETEIATFTGVSPLNAAGVMEQLGKYGRTGGQAVKVAAGVLATAAKSIKQLFTWAKKKLRDTFQNPNDLDPLEDVEGAEWTINFGPQRFNFESGSEDNKYSLLNITSDDLREKFRVALNFFQTSTNEKYWPYPSNGWTRTNYTPADMRIMMPRPTMMRYNDDLTKTLTVSEGVVEVKGKLVDTPEIYYLNSSFTSMGEILSWMSSRTGDTMYGQGATEDSSFSAYAYSFNLLYGMLRGLVQYAVVGENDYSFLPRVIQYTNVTNEDWLAAATGILKTDNPSTTATRVAANIGGWVRDAGLLQIILLTCAAYDRVINPLDYSFVPYSTVATEWSPSKFTIKSDQQNQDAISKLVASAVVAIGAQVLRGAIKLGVNKVRRTRQRVLLSKKAELDSQIREGILISDKEMKKYNRLSRKLNGLNAASGQITGFSSQAQGSENLNQLDSNSADMFNSLNRIIKG